MNKCVTAFSEGLQMSSAHKHKLFPCHNSADMSCSVSTKVGTVAFYELLTCWKLAKSCLITIHHLKKRGPFFSISIVCLNLQEVSKYCVASSFSFVISPRKFKANHFPVLIVLSSCKIQFILTTHTKTTLSSRGGWWAVPRQTPQNLLQTYVINGTITTATPSWSRWNWGMGLG